MNLLEGSLILENLDPENFFREIGRIEDLLDYMENREPSDIYEEYLREEDFYNRLLAYADLLCGLRSTIIKEHSNLDPKTVGTPLTEGFVNNNSRLELEEAYKIPSDLLEGFSEVLRYLNQPHLLEGLQGTLTRLQSLVLILFLKYELYDLEVNTEENSVIVCTHWDEPSLTFTLSSNLEEGSPLKDLIKELSEILEGLIK